MIGFIGTGTIGSPMAHQLVAGGQTLMVYDLNPDNTTSLLDAGAQLARSIAAVAERCETVFLSLPGPAQIKTVVQAANGLLANADALKHIVDLSTNAVELNRELAEVALKQNIAYLDAPVSGGRVAAEKGKLAVMIGGDKSTFEALQPLFALIGEKIFYLGPAGSGTLAKLVNNQIFLSASVLIQEGFVMGARAGMDPDTLLEVLKASSAGSLVSRAALVLSGQFDQDIFALSIAAKDVGVAVESAQALGVDMPMTKAALGVYGRAMDAGLGRDDFFATVKVLEQAAGVTLPALSKPSRG